MARRKGSGENTPPRRRDPPPGQTPLAFGSTDLPLFRPREDADPPRGKPLVRDELFVAAIGHSPKDPAEAVAAALCLGGGWMTEADVLEHTGMSSATFAQGIGALLKDGSVEKKGRGDSTRYRIFGLEVDR